LEPLKNRLGEKVYLLSFINLGGYRISDPLYEGVCVFNLQPPITSPAKGPRYGRWHLTLLLSLNA
jgi:hypothetical protein